MNDDFNNQIDETTEKTGKIAGKTAGKATFKAGKKVAKITGKVLLAILKVILPFILIPLLIISVIVLSYFIIFEFVGTEKEYTKDYENEIERNEDGIYYVKKDGMTDENKTINDYYKYMSGQTIYKSIGEELDVYNADDEEIEGVFDYYEREGNFELSSDLLYALDEQVYDWKFIYSEQFIKPVAYDEETFDLLPLTDEDGYVIIESEKQNLETGEKTGEKILSVRDYGLGSVLRYNTENDYLRTEKIMGQYIAKDVWDGEKVVKLEIEPVDFIEELSVEDIYLIDKGTSFHGNMNYEYEYKDLELEKIRIGQGTSPKEAVSDILYKVHKEKIYEEQEVTNPETGEIELKNVHVDTKTYNLYKYRDLDSAVYENVPVVTNTTIENNEYSYFQNYLSNFEAYVPEDVITEFDFDNRIDYDSHVFDFDALFEEGYSMEIGQESDSKKARYARNYFDLIEEHSNDFNVDPYVILAIMTQESGGMSLNEDGIMQISDGDRTISAVNKNGEMETLTITQKEKTSNKSKAIRWGVMYYKDLPDSMNGDPYKAIQAYNFGKAGVRIIEEMNSKAWESDYGWLIYREAARRYYAKPGQPSISYDCMAFPEGTMPLNPSNAYGNSCHLEMVLQYYAGDEIKPLEIDEDNAWDKIVDIGKNLSEKFMQFIIVRDEDEEIPKFEHLHYVTDGRIEDIIGTARALDDELLFSDAYSDISVSLSFWNEGFMDSIASVGLSLQELIDIAPNADGYLPPINMSGKRISSYFGPRVHPITGARDFHNGVDVPAITGTPVYAVADGEVIFAGISGTMSSGGGKTIVIKHDNGTEAVYMHLSAFGVRVGNRVSQGDEVGKVGNTGGSTGPHLHFAFRVDGNYIDALGIILGE